MLRPVLFAVILALPSAGAFAQSLDGNISSGLGSGFGSGLSGGLQSGFDAGLGSRQTGRTGADLSGSGPAVGGGCAPTQVDISHTGCRPVEWLNRDSFGTYEQSVAAMGPLRGLTLDNGSGP